MYKVKMVFLVWPFSFEILDDELDVRGHPVGLDWTDIISNDMGTGVLSIPGLVFPILQDQGGEFHILGNIHCPDTCACS